MNYISTKRFKNLPSAYRNHNSTSDCFLLHGYCRDVYVEFCASHLDKQGFVIDFGELKDIKKWLDEKFDHTLVLQADDPALPTFKALEKDGLARVTVLQLVSCEGWAEYIGKYIDAYVNKKTNGRAGVKKVEVLENDKNSGIYINRGWEGDLIDTHSFVDIEDLIQDMQS